MQEATDKNQNKKQIVYEQYFDERRGNLLEVSNQFLQYIDSHEEIDILGQVEQNIILSTDNQTFKLKGINLPTSLLVVDNIGFVNLQLCNYIKMDEYDHQYEKIYDQIMETTFSLQQFKQSSMQSLIQYYGKDQLYIRYNFKISMAQFEKFLAYLHYIKIEQKWLFIPLSVQLHLMRQLLLFLAQNNISTQNFTYSMIKKIPKFQCRQLFQLLAIKFYLKQNSFFADLQKIQDQTMNQKIQHQTQYHLSYATIYHFILLQMAHAKKQYIAKQMDELIQQMMAIYLPPGIFVNILGTPELQQHLKKKIMAKHFIQGKRNNTTVRFYYNPLALQSTIKGRLNFMSSIKVRFTYQQILGIFDCMVIKQNCKSIKQVIQNGRKSIDMEDVLLKNFRKFGKQYQIKLIMPK